MGIGTSIFLIAVGAILTFAVKVTYAGGVDINTVGIILMAVGGLGIVLSLFFWNSWGGGTGRRSVRRETIVRDRDPAERDPYGRF